MKKLIIKVCVIILAVPAIIIGVLTEICIVGFKFGQNVITDYL